MANITDDQIENNYITAKARDIVDWLARRVDLTGEQRAVLVILASAIDEALESDAPGDQLVASPPGAPAAPSERSLIGR